MTPQLEALAMLNNMFESYDGRPVKNAVLSREDYALLAQALTARTSYAAPEGEATECEACAAWNLTCPKCGASPEGPCGWPTNCPTGLTPRPQLNRPSEEKS